MWTPLDRAKEQAYHDWLRDFCPDCRTRDEWWDPKRGGHRHAMVTETKRCPGCEITEQERAQIPSNAKGVKVFLIPNPTLAEES